MSEPQGVSKSRGIGTALFGVVVLLCGMMAMISPGLTGFAIINLLGILVLLAGIIRVIWAFQAGSLGKGIWAFLIGGLTILAGIALIANPLFTSGVVSILLAAYLILDGIVELAAGFKFKRLPGWGWLLFSGVVSILLGFLIWSQFPLSGAWALGVLLGIKLFLIGLVIIAAGSAVRPMAPA